jgi:diaminopimelate epimerase
MCASFLVARDNNLVKDKVLVYPKSKEELVITLKNNTLYFEGKVKHVFDATIKDIDAF